MPTLSQEAVGIQSWNKLLKEHVTGEFVVCATYWWKLNLTLCKHEKDKKEITDICWYPALSLKCLTWFNAGKVFLEY